MAATCVDTSDLGGQSPAPTSQVQPEAALTSIGGNSSSTTWVIYVVAVLIVAGLGALVMACHKSKHVDRRLTRLSMVLEPPRTPAAQAPFSLTRETSFISMHDNETEAASHSGRTSSCV
jgi:hypothetical protein